MVGLSCACLVLAGVCFFVGVEMIERISGNDRGVRFYKLSMVTLQEAARYCICASRAECLACNKEGAQP